MLTANIEPILKSATKLILKSVTKLTLMGVAILRSNLRLRFYCGVIQQMLLALNLILNL